MDSIQAVDQGLVKLAEHTSNQSINLTDNRKLTLRLVKKNKQEKMLYEKKREINLPLSGPALYHKD